MAAFTKWVAFVFEGHYVDTMIALILGSDFFTCSAVLAVALTKLVLYFDDKSQDSTASNGFHTEANYVFLKFFFTTLMCFCC